MADNILDVNEMLFDKFEPKLKNRFILEVDGIPSFLIKTAARPEITINEVELDHINIKKYSAGKIEYGTVDLTLYDPISPSGAQIVMNWIRAHHEAETGRSGYGAMYQKDITITELGPVGDKISAWTLKKAWITSVNFGDLDWSAGEVQEISISLRYDYPVMEY